jgi:hypothetical protein
MPGPLHERLGEAFFKQVPSMPGVYLMVDDRGDLLYVGKAKSLRTRLRSYARITADDDQRLVLLVSAVAAIRWEECASDELALVRETELLRAMRPPFNFTHTASTEYLGIAVAGRGDHVRLRLTADDAQPGESLYGCFPFAAATPDAYAALLRVLHLAQPGAGPRPPSRVTRATGYELTLAPETRAPLRTFLSGRSKRLLSTVDHLITEQHGDDPLVARRVARDLDVLWPFYELGPKAVRRLQLRHGGRSGSVTGSELAALLAREMGAQVGAAPRVDRQAIERRIAALREEHLGLGAIARRLNDDGIARLRGGGKWRAADVAEIVSEQLARATTTAALSANLRQ